MKTKKILFKVAGILQFLSCGFLAFVGVVLLLLRPLVTAVIDNAYNEFQTEIKNMSAEKIAEEGLDIFLEFTKEEFAAYLMKWTMIFAVIVLAIAIIGIIFGVIFIKCSKKYEYMLENKKGRKIWLGVLSTIFCGLSIPTFIVIIALCISDKKKTKDGSQQTEVNS